MERFLPDAPARILEVGAGGGAVSRALAARGYRVDALDESLESSELRDSPHRDEPPSPHSVRWIPADFLQFEPDDRYDAVLFTRSLHHMPPVDRTLDRARAALVDGGILLAEEFAFDRVNVHTARWLYDFESVLVAAGLVSPAEPQHAAERRPLARWRLEHTYDPPLVTGHDMLAAARERFSISAVEEAPYLYRYLGERWRDTSREAPAIEALFELENRLIRERDIAAAGLRFVGSA